MKKVFKTFLVIQLIIYILLILHTDSYAIFFRGNATIYNNVYVIPYGRKLAKEEGETITTDNNSIAETTDNSITIKGTGYFKLTSTINSQYEEYNMFSWNTFLIKGDYFTYKDKELTQKAGIMKSPTYLSTELDTSTGTLKIIDAYPSNQIGALKNTYIKSYYDPNSKLSTSVYFQYSFEIEDEVEAPKQDDPKQDDPKQDDLKQDDPQPATGKPEYQYSKKGKSKGSFKNDSISVKIESIGKYLVTKIWVKDPSKQVKKKEAGWNSKLKTVSSMLNGTQNAIVGCNGSGFYLAGSWEPSEKAIKNLGKSKWNKTTEGYLVISNGTVRRKVGGQKCNTILGILPNGSFKYYETNPYTDVINDGVKNTYCFGPLIIKDGKSYTQSNKKVRIRKSYTTSRKATCVGQVDENNFILINTNGSNTTLTEVRKLGLQLDCQMLFNMDGGGSATLWFRKGTSGKGKNLAGGGRSVGDALYFVSQ